MYMIVAFLDNGSRLYLGMIEWNSMRWDDTPNSAVQMNRELAFNIVRETRQRIEKRLGYTPVIVPVES